MLSLKIGLVTPVLWKGKEMTICSKLYTWPESPFFASTFCIIHTIYFDVMLCFLFTSYNFYTHGNTLSSLCVGNCSQWKLLSWWFERLALACPAIFHTLRIRPHSKKFCPWLSLGHHLLLIRYILLWLTTFS